MRREKKSHGKLFQRFPDRKTHILFGALAVIFSFLLVLSKSFEKTDSLYNVFGNTKSVVFSFIKMLGWFFVLYEGSRLAVTLHLGTWIREKSIRMPKGIWNKKRTAWFLFLIILICWVPYYIMFFPGSMTPDAQDELAQVFQDKENSWTYNTIVHENPEDNTINNHHPVFYTCFMGVFVQFGRLLGDINAGIAIFSFIQMLLVIVGMVYFLSFLKKKKIPLLYLYITLAFFAFYPVFPIYAVTVSKDILFAVALLWVSIELCIFLDGAEQGWKRGRHMCLYIISLIFLCLLRSNGAYIIIALIPFVFAAGGKIRVKMLLATMAPLLFYFIFFVRILLPAFEIESASPREMLSLPFQQIARYASEYGRGGFEMGEIEQLNKVMNFGNNLSVLAERYNPVFADRVKNYFRKEATDEEVRDCLVIWMRLVARHPGTCIAATLNNNYLLLNDIGCGGNVIYANITDVYLEKEKWYGVRENEQFHAERGFLDEFLYACSQIPVIGLPYAIGWYDWLILFCIVFCLSKRKYRETVCILPMLFCIGTTVLGPVIYMRYAIQWILLTPMAGAMCLSIHKKVSL